MMAEKLAVRLKNFGFVGYLRILFTTLDKDYSREREDSFFSYLRKGLGSLFVRRDKYTFRIIVENKFAGNIGLFNPVREEYELGYFLLRGFRNKGVATEAVRQIIQIAKEKGIKKIFAITDTPNIPSQKVLEKNGFKINKKKSPKGEVFLWRKV